MRFDLTEKQMRDLPVVLRALEGTLYRYGGNVPSDGGLDCSGFVQWVWRCLGIEPWASRFPTGLDLSADMMRLQLAQTVEPTPGCAALYYAEGGKVAEHAVLLSECVGGEYVLWGASRGFKGLVSVEEARVKKAWARQVAKGKDAQNYRHGFAGWFAPVLVRP